VYHIHKLFTQEVLVQVADWWEPRLSASTFRCMDQGSVFIVTVAPVRRRVSSKCAAQLGEGLLEGSYNVLQTPPTRTTPRKLRWNV
jgi:hypothetical protein